MCFMPTNETCGIVNYYSTFRLRINDAQIGLIFFYVLAWVVINIRGSSVTRLSLEQQQLFCCSKGAYLIILLVLFEQKQHTYNNRMCAQIAPCSFSNDYGLFLLLFCVLSAKEVHHVLKLHLGDLIKFVLGGIRRGPLRSERLQCVLFTYSDIRRGQMEEKQMLKSLARRLYSSIGKSFKRL